MKTKNIKRLWPVPMTLAVVALAAFLAFGLLATNGTQTAEAQSALDPPNITAPDGTTGCDVVVGVLSGTSPHNLKTVGGGKCTTSGDSVTVTFVNKDDAASDVAVYVTGGDDFRKVQASKIAEASNSVAVFDVNKMSKVGVDEYLFSVSASNIQGDGEEMVTVDRTMADDDSVVYLSVFGAEQTLVAASTSLSGRATTNVKVVFLNEPVAKADTDGDATNADAVTSALVLTAGGTALTDVVADTPGGLESGVNEIVDLPDSATSIQISAEFNDENVRGISGNIVFAIGTPSAGAEEVKFVGGGSERTAFTNSVGSFVIVDIPEDIAVRIPVTATITAETGTLTLEGNIIRLGDAAMVTAKAYACEINEGDTNYNAGPPATADIGAECVSELAALNKSGTEGDPEEIGALETGDFFTIFGEAVDMLGNKLDGPLTWKPTPDTDTGEVLSASGNAETVITVGADDDQLGSYSITVESADGVASTIIEFDVSGPPTDYLIEGPAEIEIDGDGFASYEVTATDINGNPAAGTNCVTVRVRGVDFDEDQDLSVPMSDDCTDDDTDKTEVGATFTIDAPPGIAAGTTATIQIRVDGKVEARRVITFVSMSVEPEPMLTAPTGVMATADAGTVTVTWTDGADALGHMVLLFNADFSGAPMVNAAPTGSSAEFMDVAAGDYVAVVVSYRSGSEYMYDYMSVTVN